jgi:hypothetical protein
MRLKRTENEALARQIIAVSLNLLDERGYTEDEFGGQGLVRCLDMEDIKMIHTNPFSKLIGMPAPNGLDIWWKRKVFSVWWDPFEIINFKYGEWMNELVPGSFKKAVAKPRKVKRQISRTFYVLDLPLGGLPKGPLQWVEDPETGRLTLSPKP